VPGDGDRIAAAAEPLRPREERLDGQGAGGGIRHRPVAARRQVLPEVGLRVEERRGPGRQRLPEERPEDR
jgi:hypothetical protein